MFLCKKSVINLVIKLQIKILEIHIKPASNAKEKVVTNSRGQQYVIADILKKSHCFSVQHAVSVSCRS